MPNTQTSVPAFTAGQVLTAAQMTEVNTGIPVFATTVTRDAAFGGTGEKTLAEGQFAYIEATNTTQYYDGSAWQNVGSSGLVCVKAETAFSAVANFTADNVFTSAYTNYRMLIRFTTSTGDVSMQFRASGVDTTTNYNYQQLRGASATVSSNRSASQSSGRIGENTSGSFFSLCSIDISGVQLAEPTIYSSLDAKTNSTYADPSVVHFFGNQSDSTAFDGIKVLVSTGTMTGSYTIYGYAKTV
jgi:hypothetical protein